MASEEKNAVITSATITNDDHGLLTAWIQLDFGGSGQGFGGFALYLPNDFSHSNNQRNFAGHFIWRMMEVAGVDEWSKLPGKTIRAKGDHQGIEAVGHVIKDDWFDPKSEFEQMKL